MRMLQEEKRLQWQSRVRACFRKKKDCDGSHACARVSQRKKTCKYFEVISEAYMV